MLPQLGEMLSHGSRASAAPFMSACIIVTQVVIMFFAPAVGRFANLHGRKPLLMVGFGVLPVRALLYTLTHNIGGLIAIQLLDGVANAIFGVVSILVVADRARATGRFNLVQGSLATAAGLGAALSTTFGGKLIQHFSYRISFLSLGVIAAIAFVLLWTAIPETLTSANDPDKNTSSPGDSSMNLLASKRPFQPQSPDAAGVISWVHLGDLHMTKAGEQNHLDLAEIVNEVNQAFADSVSFIFLPGDVADDGSRSAYAAVRGELDRLHAPWCAILGDHDVHEKSFANFREAMSDRNYYAFTVGDVRFVARNAFDVPEPPSFTVSDEQLRWAEDELQRAHQAGQTKVLLLHCYPSDLKVGGDEVSRLVREYDVRLVDMGHTHYNEIANNGRTLYSATRSTRQIEEGPVGYSVVNIDDGVVSWRFVELGKLPVAVILSPSDERLLTESSETAYGMLKVRAKFWGEAEAVEATAYLGGQTLPMKRIANSQVWEVDVPSPQEGVHPLEVCLRDADGDVATDEIRLAIGQQTERKSEECDQDNALEAWPEHGLLGTQLGPNKNGKKW
jgi:predicted phosphodiesterase